MRFLSFVLVLLLLCSGNEMKGKAMDAIAVFGGGCFWCLEAIFQHVRGVEEVIPGYAGGHVPNPTYEEVCSGTTGHAEVVRITYDPSMISYEKLLEIFWTIHDPTTPNRQGNDIGPQYRSIILYLNPMQKETAERVMRDFAQKIWDKPIVTEITPLDTFYPAEQYHWNYFSRNPDKAYCQLVINPKVQKFRKQYRHLLKDAVEE